MYPMLLNIVSNIVTYFDYMCEIDIKCGFIVLNHCIQLLHIICSKSTTM